MASAIACPPRLIVRKDLRTVRKTLRQLKESVCLKPLNLFNRRNPEKMLEYIERRSHSRTQANLLVNLTPVRFDGMCIEPYSSYQDSVLGITKDISLRGISVTHDEPLEACYAVATFELDGDITISVLLEIRWTNHAEHGAYYSGGRFLAITEAL